MRAFYIRYLKLRYCRTCGGLHRKAAERDQGMPACRKCGNAF